MAFSHTNFRVALNARRTVALALVLSSTTLAGCVDPVSLVASSVLSAALKTAVEQAEKSRPTPEDLWHEAQLAALEREARSGAATAQFRLGTYYVQTQESKAQVWICFAASQGHARAQLQYGHWFNEDRAREDLFPFITITPNNSDAFLWYALAAKNGESRASHFRDSLIYGGIQTAKLDHARARLANWSAQDCGSPPAATPTVNEALADAR
jgi:TPR repeat protein